MGFDFSLVDVFSDWPFGGNQLAVFPDAAGIADETMQRLAREFNFSETTFVLPPTDPSCTCRVRIFTPRQELPFAGHPTLGTAAVLARRNGAQAARQYVFEEGIGPVTVTVDGPEISLHLRSPRYETTDEAPPAAVIAKALTLPEDAIVESWYARVGLRFCFVRVTGPDLVDRAVLDKGAWAAAIADSWSPELYLFDGNHRDGENDGQDKLPQVPAAAGRNNQPGRYRRCRSCRPERKPCLRSRRAAPPRPASPESESFRVGLPREPGDRAGRQPRHRPPPRFAGRPNSRP